MLEQDAWHTELAPEADHRHPGRAAGCQVLARQLVGLAAAEAQHSAGLLHRKEVRGPVINRNGEIFAHDNTCLQKSGFVTLTPLTVELDRWRGERHDASEGYRARKSQGAARNRCQMDRCSDPHSGYRCDMARNADSLPVEPVIDLVDDGLSDAEIATRFTEWLSDLATVPVVALPISAIDELRNAYADEDV